MIYLDHAASTPVDPRVVSAMIAVLEHPLAFANPSSSHTAGREASAYIETARSQVAALVGVQTEDLLFTSGATESDNLALLGLARGRADFGRHIISSRTEHKAVLDPLKRLEKEGFTVTWLEPSADGRIAPLAVRAALRPDTQLVSIMHANNETGVVQDIAAIAAVCREQGAFFHCDATQSVGKLPLDVAMLGIDLVAFSAHKVYGPKGVGALYVAPRARPWVLPLAFGGGQERGLRPGTLPTHQIVGFGAAAQIAAQRLDSDALHAKSLVDAFVAALAGVAGVRRNDHPHARLPGLVSISIADVEGESLLAEIPELAVSSGAACDASRGEPSYVLRALGVAPELAQSTLRIAFGRGNTVVEAVRAATLIREGVERLRARYAPRNAVDATWHTGRAGSQRVGTEVVCHLRTDDAGRIAAVRFALFGCPQVRAAIESIERQWPGLPLAPEGDWSRELGTPADWARAVGAPVEKLGRFLLVEDAMRLATLSAIDASRGA